jgi:ATP-dependent RNA helicase DeaD
VHRSGRTGRAGQKGKSVMLALKSHEAKLRRIYSQARVQPTWAWPPSPDAVFRRQMERAERHAAAAIAAHTLTDSQREVAQHLLRDRDAVDVVAALLIQAGQGPRAPFAFAGQPTVAPIAQPSVARATAAPAAPAPVAAVPAASTDAAPAPMPAATKAVPPAPKAESPAPKAESPAPKVVPAPTPVVEAKPARQRAKPSLAEVGLHDESPAVRDQQVASPASELLQEPEQRVERRPLPTRGKALAQPAWKRREEPAAPEARGGSEPGFTRFCINWGLRDGAEPRRILAHICRRGNIDSRMVGHIEMRGTMSLFDVADDVAVGFGRRVQARDRRDPHLRITRWYERGKRGDDAQERTADEG